MFIVQPCLYLTCPPPKEGILALGVECTLAANTACALPNPPLPRINLPFFWLVHFFLAHLRLSPATNIDISVFSWFIGRKPLKFIDKLSLKISEGGWGTLVGPETSWL